MSVGDEEFKLDDDDDARTTRPPYARVDTRAPERRPELARRLELELELELEPEPELELGSG